MRCQGAACVVAEKLLLFLLNIHSVSVELYFLSLVLSIEIELDGQSVSQGSYLHVPEDGGTLFRFSVPDRQSLPGQTIHMLVQCTDEECFEYAAKFIGIPNL